MPLVEKVNEIYDENGYVETVIVLVEEPEIDDQILEKEDELLRIYNEIQELKLRKEQDADKPTDNI